MTQVNYGKANFSPLAASPSIQPGWSSGLNPGAWTGIGAMGALGGTLQQMVQKEYQQKLVNQQFQQTIFNELMKSSDPSIRAHLMAGLMTGKNTPQWMQGIKVTPEEQQLQNLVNPSKSTGLADGSGINNTSIAPAVQGPPPLPSSSGDMPGQPPSQFMNRRTSPGGGSGAVPPSFLGRPPAADMEGASGQGQPGPLAQPSGANNPVLPQNQPANAPLQNVGYGPAATGAAPVTPPPAPSTPAPAQGGSGLMALNMSLGGQDPLIQKLAYAEKAAQAMGYSPEETKQLMMQLSNPNMSKVIYQQGEQDRRLDRTLGARKENLTTTEEGKATRQKTAIEARTAENQVAVPDDLAKAMRLPQGAKVPKVLLHEYEQNLRSAQATGGKIDAAKIFAQAATNRMLGTPIPVLTTDDGTPTGHPVTQYMSRADATNHVFTRPEIATIRDRQMVAGTSSAVGHDLLHEIEDGDGQYHDSVGPVLGRYNNLAAAAGEGDPTAQQLKGEIMGWTSMLMKVHGSRAYKIASDARDLLSTAQTPEALSGGLRGLLTISDKLSGTDNQANAAAPATPTRPKVTPPPGAKPAKDPLGLYQ